ncbi:unnamed protein product [Jaminaea pallidilutea]
MSQHFSSYANNLLSSKSDRRAQTTASPSSGNSKHKAAAESRLQFDPLLRSTFGHRSVDLYGSQVDNGSDEEAYDEEGSQLDDRNYGGRSQRGGPSAASSSLINASRYGPSRGTRNTSDLPEIEDERYYDEEDEETAVNGRGVDMSQFQHHGPGSSSMLVASDELHGQNTPSASFNASQREKHRGRSASNASGNGADEGVDPFLIEGDSDERASVEGRLVSARDEDASTATSIASASVADVATTPRRDLQRNLDVPTSAKGKAKAREIRVSPHAGKGWIAHSDGGSSSSKARKHSKPLRDAYSIYDDDEEDTESMSEETDESDEETQSANGGSRRHLKGSTSTIHHPTKMSASQFARSHARIDSDLSSHQTDDFHKKLPSAQRASGSQSIYDDSYRYPNVNSELTSWKPWARGNNPSLKEWKDSSALLVWAVAMVVTVVLAGGASLGVETPKAPSSPATRPSPYYTLTRSLPLLILLSALSLGMATLNLAFLRNLNRLGGATILRFALIATPAVLTLGWAWAFAGSFFFDDQQWSGGRWSTTGLRTLSLVPLVLAIAFSRLLYVKRAGLARSLSVLSLTAKIVSAHPTLLLLSLVQILVFLALSMPFMTIFIRLFLLGHFADKSGTGDEWITDRRARLLAWGTLATWIWTWAALRGIMRVVVSSVVSHWYFYGPPSEDEDSAHMAPTLGREQSNSRGAKQAEAGDDRDEEEETGSNAEAESEMIGLEDSSEDLDSDEDEEQLAHRNPTASDLVRASFLRATGPSLGTILLSALLLASSRVLVLLSFVTRTLASILSSPSVPSFLHPLAHLAYLLSGAGGVIKGVSDYTLIYTGITGQGFWASSRRCSRLLVRNTAGRSGRSKGILEGLIISTILSLLTISLSLLAALAGFLFSAHQLHVPADAPLVGLLCGVVPYWTLRLAADVLGNGADALYLCYAIDEPQHDVGGNARAEPEHNSPSSAMEARQAFEMPGGSSKILPF